MSIFGTRLFVRRAPRNLSIPFQYLIVIEFQKRVYALGKFRHRKRIAALDQSLNIIEKSRDRPFEKANLRCRKIILCHKNIALQNAPIRNILPSRKSHVILCMVGTFMNYLRRCLSSNGIMEFILNHPVKITCNLRIFIIISRTFSKYVCNLLPNTPFAGTNGTDPFKQLTKIVLSERIPTFFKTLIIKSKSFDNVFFQYTCRPNTKLRGTAGIYSIPNRNNDIKIVIINQMALVFAFYRTMSSGCFHFGNNHIFH